MKLVHLVGFIIKKFVTMQHGHVNVKYVILYVTHFKAVNNFKDVNNYSNINVNKVSYKSTFCTVCTGYVKFGEIA